MHRPNSMTHSAALVAAAAALAAAGVASAQTTVASDSFDNRTTGEPDIFSPNFGSDWGEAEFYSNGVGPYVLNETPSSEFDVEYIREGTARLNFGRVILDANLATPEVIQNGNLTISFDVNPADNGNANGAGRDWAGIALGDSNAAVGSVGGSGFLTGGNPDSRIGIAPRNSGSLLSNVKPGGLRGDGNPDGGINEPIIDSATYDRYLDYFNAPAGTTPSLADGDNFPNDAFYNVSLTVSETAPGNLFADDALLNYDLTIDGQSVVLPQAPDGTFVWGDNNPLTASGGADPAAGDRLAYLVFAGNTGEHQYDNLLVTTMAMMQRLAGDANGDGSVTIADFAILRANFGTTGSSFEMGDFNEDGSVTIADFAILRANFGSSVSSAQLAEADAWAASVPEPATLGLVAAAGLGLVRRRR